MTANPDRTEIDALKARVDLVELFRQSDLELKKVGKNYLCRCPFHDDKEASLSINGERQLWNCFACEAGGDAFEFLRLREKMAFPEALKRLQELAGPLPITKETSPDLLAGNFKRSELLERVMEHYQKRFRETPAAQQYLNRRGLDSRELWDAFRIGYCDGSFAAALPTAGPVKEALTQLGVLNDKGKEVLRGCVVVPLSHPEQGLLGLYGRRMDPEAKVKHQYLPGPHRGVLNWQALQLSPKVLVAESVFDALSLWRAGLTEATCIFGVQGIPQELERLLSHYGVREVTFCLDGDRAGREAADKLSQRFLERGLVCRRVLLPDDKDPNQILMERGAEALREMTRHREEVPLAASSEVEETAQVQQGSDGFLVRLGAISYQLWPQPPFNSRLRARLRAIHDHRMVMDTVDFYVNRSRRSILQQICGQLEVPKIEAERHLIFLLEKMEEWVRERKEQDREDSEEAPQAVVLTEKEKEQGLEFLRRSDLVARVLSDMEELGYVGEHKSKLLVYFVGISRKLETPLSAIVRSQSGAGKSSLTELVELLAPPEDVVMFSRITPQALYWMPRTAIKRKILLLEERTGGEGADYSIRTLQTRKKLMQAATVKDPATGKLMTKTFIVEGPIAFLETTTDSKINYENATRCFEITLDESQEQTRRIQACQRANRLPSRKDRRNDREIIRQKHHNAQRLLETVLVYIPYVELLSFPSRWLRTRRDNERFLCLIEAAAFLHQHQRESGLTEDGSPYILASLEDYRLAYELAKDVLSYTLQELSRESQELLDSIREWLADSKLNKAKDVQFTRRDLRDLTGIEDYRLRQSLQELVEMEYVEALTGGQGRTYHYRLVATQNSDRPNALRELTTPEELERRWGGQ